MKTVAQAQITLSTVKDGIGYSVNIKGGIRGIAYAADGSTPEPSTIDTVYSVELLKDGKVVKPFSCKWTSGGNLSGTSTVETFKPVISKNYISADTYVAVEVIPSEGLEAIVQTMPIVSTKFADGLDWIADWNSTKTEIKGEKIVTPRIFAGINNGSGLTPNLTGVALGRDVLTGSSSAVGLVGYKNNLPVFKLDQNANFLLSPKGSSGEVIDGDSNGLYFNGETLYISGNVKIQGGSVGNTSIEDLEDGINLSVSKVDVLYAKNQDPNTTPPADSFTTDAPQWENGYYIWSKTRTTFRNGEYTETEAVCITGAKGQSGSSGKGISKTAISYIASTSGTVVPTGTWKDTIPSVAENQYLWTRTVITYTDNTTSTSYSVGKMGAKGDSGASAKYVIVNGEQLFKYTNNFSGTPTPSSITLTATLIGTTGYQWSYRTPGSTTNTNISGATGATLSLAHDNTIWGNNKQITIRCTSGDQYDEITIAKVSDGAKGDSGDAGADAYTIILTNESHTFAGSTSAALAASATCEVIAYKGSSRVAATIGTITGLPTGMTAPISNNGTTTAKFTPTVTTSMTTKSGMLTIPITVDGKSFTKNFAYSLALKGSTGATGTGVSSTRIDYVASTSGTVVPSSGWSSSIPTVAANQYLWTRTTISYTNNMADSVSYSVGKMGAQGEEGRGIVSIVELYKILSTKEQQPTPTSDSGWSTTPPTWSSGKYIHSCSKITYKNPSGVEYTKPICDSSWEAVNEIQVGGRNLARNTKDISSLNKGEWSVADDEEDGFKYLTITTTSTSWQECQIGVYPIYNTLTSNVTVSFEYQNTTTGLLVFNFGAYVSSTNGRVAEITNWLVDSDFKTENLANGWKKAYLTFDPSSVNNKTNANAYRLQFKKNSGKTGTIKIRKIKLEKGNKVTDWTPAPEDIQAEIDANERVLAELANDNKLTPNEKQIARKEWDTIKNEYSKIIAQATKYSVSSTTYTNHYNTLNSYLSNLLSDSLLNTTSDIVGTTFRTNFTNYYSAKQDLLNQIATKSKDEIDNIDASLSNKIKKEGLSTGYVNSSGNVISEAAWYYTDYIPVVAGEHYVASGYTNLGNAPSTCFYNSSKTFISGINNGNSVGTATQTTIVNDKCRNLTIPANCAYMRFSFMKADLGKIRLEKKLKNEDFITVTQNEVFNTLTNNGEKQGIYLQDRKLYINAEYMKVGTIASVAGNSSLNLSTGELMLGTTSSNSYLQWTGSALNIKANSINIGSNKVATNSDVTNAVNSIQIGGKNLIANSGFLKGTSYWTAENLTVAVTDDSIYGKILRVSNPTGQRIFNSVNNVWKKGQIYTVSFYAKSSTAGGMIAPSRSLIDYGATQKLTTEWQRYSCTLVSGETISGGTLSLSFSNASEIYITRIKLEMGNKPTDWSLAQEDIDNAIGGKVDNTQSAIFNKLFSNGTQGFILENGKVYINGEVIKANAISGEAIKANTLSASKITTGTLDASKVNVTNLKAGNITSGTIGADRLDANTIVSKVNGASTTVSGNKIRTGIIQANSGGSYLNLDNGSMMLGTTSGTSYLQWTGSALNIKASSLKIGAESVATSSEVTQSAKDLTLKFKSSGGYNLVKNSCFFNGLSSWTTDNIDTAGTSKSISYWTDSNQYILPNTNAVVIRGTNLTNRYGITQSVKIKRGQKYTVSALSASHRGKTIRITIRNGNGGGHLLNVTAGLANAGKNISGWNKMEGTFTAPTDSDYITVCLYMDGSGSDGYVWFTQIMVNEGEAKQAWSPHPSEVYEGSTVIDASGVTVKNGALRVQNNAGQTVLSGDSNGNLTLTGSVNSSNLTISNGGIRINNKSGQTVMSSDSYGNLLLSGGNMRIQNLRGGVLDIAEFFGGSMGAGLSLTSYGAETGNQQSSVSIWLDTNDLDRMKISAESVTIQGVKGGSLYTSDITARTSLSTKQLWSNGNQILNGSDTWLRTYGNTGWFNGTYSGGWHMQDTTWIRAYNGKAVYTTNVMRADGGYQLNGGSTGIQSGGQNTVKIATPSGYGEIGARNTSYFHFSTDRPRFYFYQPVEVNSDIQANGYMYCRAGVLYLGQGSNSSYVAFHDSSGARKGYIGKGDAGSNLIYISADVEKTIVTIGHLCPSANRTYWLGTNSPARQWKGLCAEGGTVGASDIRSKENIERLDGTIVSYNEVTREIKEFELSNYSRSNKRALENDYYEFIKDRFKPTYYNYKLTEHINEETQEYVLDPEDEYKMLKNVGFLAQDYDLENDKVAQEFIFKNPDGELSYNHMSYVTVGMIALQEATKKIELLEKENQQLKEDIKKIKESLGII